APAARRPGWVIPPTPYPGIGAPPGLPGRGAGSSPDSRPRPGGPSVKACHTPPSRAPRRQDRWRRHDRFPGYPVPFLRPPCSGTGGYACGRIAAHVDGPATVTLPRPPPLATPMAVERDREGSVRIHDGPTLIAEAATSPGGPGPQIPGLVTLAQA